MTTIESKEDEELAFYLDILRKNLRDIEKKFKINYLGIFGSYVKKEQKKGSDIDILVDFFETPSLFQFIRLEHYLSELLKTKVDLVMKDALKLNIGKQILKEVIKV
ncbi:MAG: nucleotidyltransferase family protein [Candidatus Heimdallarchaeota archaeon]|nr:nucleotidyltransferase family protein [Candidatus Heimdallarchaeota archaeon]